LRFDTLSAVHDKHRSLTGGEGPRNLIVEIDVPRCVDEIQIIVLTVKGFVDKANSAGFYGDSAFALNIHIIKELFLHVPLVNRAGKLKYTVGKGGFPMIYMGYDGKIPYILNNNSPKNRHT
jgi:hypothetical protein